MQWWRTRHFPELTMHHLKNEGTGIGFLKTNIMHGEIYYMTGGSKIFFIAKVIHRLITGRPVVISGIMLLYGYLKPFLKREKTTC